MDSYFALFDMIGVLAHRRYQMAERTFATIGLNHSEGRLLNILRQEGGKASQDALSALMFIDRSNAGRALKRLEAQGYITRCKDSADQRTNLVTLTQKGHKAVKMIAQLKQQIVRNFFGEMAEQDAAKAVELLKKALSEEEFEYRTHVPGTNRPSGKA